MAIYQGLVIFGAAALGGMINAVAGGGTLLTFPSLIWIGLSPITANATSTLALLPGSVGSMWGYRRELGRAESRFLVLLGPSLVGGIAGAVLLRRTPPAVFDTLVPFLVLFATLLFAAQGPIQRRLRGGDPAGQPATAAWLAGAFLFQFLVAVYGGYFGAGIGILMLAALGLLGLTDIHQMNGLKNLFGLSINVVAAIYFIWAGLIRWPEAAVMAAGAIVGGYGGAGLARWLGRSVVRTAVIVIGLVMTVAMFLKIK
jgi:uncharacterized protein